MEIRPLDTPTHTPDEIFWHLQDHLEDCTVKNPSFFKHFLVVQRRAALAFVKLENGQIKIKTGVNAQYAGIWVPFVAIGIMTWFATGGLYGLIAATIAIANAYPATKTTRAVLKEDIENVLSKI